MILIIFAPTIHPILSSLSSPIIPNDAHPLSSHSLTSRPTQVSLVTEGGGLFQTFLSWAKYATTIESVLIKPADELSPETDSMMKLVCHAQWYVGAEMF